MKIKTLLSVALLGASVFASADWNWKLSSTYTWAMDGSWGGADVTNIIAHMEGGSVENSYGWGVTSWSFSNADSPLTMTFDTGWFDPQAAEPTLTGSLFMGIVQDLPSDAPGQEHVVFFMDSHAASNIANIAWGTVFAGLPPEHTYTEEAVLQAIKDFTNPPNQASFDAADALLTDFQTYTAKHARVGDFGTEGSMYFGPSDSFSIVAFSDATIGGSGSGTVDTIQEPVPEPASMLVLGLGAVAVARRRRKS